ncbi:MAG: DUF6768 family protein [Cyclobacteriaceae bacterium]
MKTEKEEIDRLIEQALTEEEAVFYHKLDEQNILEMFGGLFQGKMKWLTVMTLIVQCIMFGFAVYFGYRFFNTTDLVELIQFGAGASLLMMGVGMLKMYHWLEITKNATIREIKRMELQVSVLAGRLKEKG